MFSGLLRGNVDVSFQFGVLVHSGQQRLRGYVVAQVHRDVTNDAIKRGGQVVVGEFALLGDASGGRGFPIRLGILERLHRKFVVLLTAHTPSYKLPLALDLALVVVEGCLLLRFGAALLVNRRLLLQRIDRHQHLAGVHVVARLHQDPRQ